MTVVLEFLFFFHTRQTLLRFANVSTNVRFLHPIGKGVSLFG